MKNKLLVFLAFLSIVSLGTNKIYECLAQKETKVSRDDLVILDDNQIINETGWKLAQYEYRSFFKDLSDFPASFTYNGKEYHGFSEDFTLVSDESNIQSGKEERTTILRHKDDFKVRIESAFYLGYGAYEWTIYFENDGENNTGIIESLNGCDISFLGTNPHLKGMLGDQYSTYYPYDHNLVKGNVYYSTTTGRACEEFFPYFNLENDSGGALVALGWPGNWEADFIYQNKETRIKTRQKNLQTYLKPGESLRTPLTAVVRYGTRDEDLAMNQWRKWYIDWVLPHPNGEALKPRVVYHSTTDENVSTTEEVLLKATRKFAQNGIRFDYLWIDAGWYVKPDQSKVGSWMEVGTWDVDETRFPTKFKAVSDYANSLGTKTILWFEPETIRVNLDQMIANYGFKQEWATVDNSWGSAWLVDFTNPEFSEWLLNKVNTVLQEGGFSMYREDFNVRPAGAWAEHDSENRIGLYENKYLTEHLKFWDKILETNPGIEIDSCASGGNRNDLESMRRAFPMHVSDSGYGEYGGKQSMYYQLYKWLPFFGLPATSYDSLKTVRTYDLRSSYSCSFNLIYNYDLKEQDYQTMYDCIREYRTISKYLCSDYYPITPYSRSESGIIGWEFFDNSLQEGFVQLFCQNYCYDETYLLQLKGLDDNASYVITDFDGINSMTKTGKELKDGVRVEFLNPRSAFIATIKKEK